MNYGDHNFIEITQQTKLRVEPVELDFVERVDRLARQSRARRASRAVLFYNVDTRSNSTWLDSTRHVRRVEPMHFGCVELVEQHSSTRSTRRARLAT